MVIPQHLLYMLVAKMHTEVMLEDNAPASLPFYPMYLTQSLSGVGRWRGIITAVDWHGFDVFCQVTSHRTGENGLKLCQVENQEIFFQ